MLGFSPGSADAESMYATAVVWLSSAAAIRAMPRESMSTFAPPATASVTRARMSASGSRNTGDVIPWSSAQMTEVFVGLFRTRFNRIVLPRLMWSPLSGLGGEDDLERLATADPRERLGRVVERHHVGHDAADVGRVLVEHVERLQLVAVAGGV